MSGGLTGDIFSLSADSQYEGRWQGIDVVRANANIDVGVALTAEANFCHGVEIALEARASAETQAALSVFLSAGVELQAFAQAGANIRVSMAPDLFDRFGLVADAGAFAEAAVAGRLKIGLSIDQIKQLAEALVGGNVPFLPNQMALDIFGYFLDELNIGAGVWGRAAYSAMARAHLEVYGSLADPANSGFVIEGGGSVGLKGGTGWDFFAFAELIDVHRFYARTSDRITEEVVMIARAELDGEFEPAIQLLDLCLPAVLQVAMVAGQTTATSLIANSDRVVEPTVRAILEQMRRFILRKFVEIAEKMLVELIDNIAEMILGEQLDETQRDSLEVKVQSLSDRLTGVNSWDLDRFVETASDLTDVGTIVFPDDARHWREPLTIAWCGLATIHALNEAHSAFSAGGSVNVFGLGVSVDLSEDDFDLPAAPSVVLDEFEATMGARPNTLRFSDAVDYIAGSTVEPMIDVYLPDLSRLLEMVEAKFDLTPGDFVSAFLLGTVGGDLSTTELYLKLRELLRESIDNEIDTQLLPALRSVLGNSHEAHLYMAEVVEPSLLGCSKFVFKQLDDIVGGSFDMSTLGSFRMGLSTLVYKVFARNVIVLGNILHEHVLDSLEDNLGVLRDEIERDPDHVMVDAAVGISDVLTVNSVSPETLRSANHRLITQLIAAGQTAFGSSIWTGDRRTALRRLMLEALVGDDSGVDYRADSDVIAQAFAILASCNHKPNEAALLELGGLMADVTLDQLEVILTIVAPAIAEFFLAITIEPVEAMDRIAREWIDGLARFADEALRQINYWIGEINRLLEDVEAAAITVANRLGQIEDQLDSSGDRDAILDALHSRGVATVIQQVSANTPGWDSLNASARSAALSIPLATFDAAFSVARPLLDDGLETVGSFAGNLETVIEAATTVDDAAAATAGWSIQSIKDSINDQISQFGLALPDELSVDDVANVAKDFLITDEIAAWSRQAWIAISEQNDLQLQIADAEREKEKAERTHQKEAANRSRVLGENISIEFHSPASLSGAAHENFVYGPKIPIKIDIHGANASFIEAGLPNRIFFAINGSTIQFHAEDWQETENGIRLIAEIDFGQTPLESGLNILQCSVSDGVKTVLRREVQFLLDPTAPVVNVVKVLPEESTFNVPGNDHLQTSSEFVTFKNTGNAPAILHQWELRDRAGHTFEFPDKTLSPGATIRIVTGDGTDTDVQLHWGRSHAVWNNTGDAVYLVDSDRFVRSEFVYDSIKDQ